jgi:hypothetical protein
MDTFKEKTMFDEMYAIGNTPWTIWDTSPKQLIHRSQLKTQVSDSNLVQIALK